MSDLSSLAQAAKPKPKAPPVQNPYEREKYENEFKNMADTIANAPKDIVQAGVDQMWAAIYGVPQSQIENQRKAEQNGGSTHTPLDFDKLNEAYARGDMEEANRIQESMQKKQQEKAANASQHRTYQSSVERAIKELEHKDQQREKQMEEEEFQKKQQEQQAAAAANSAPIGGQGKAKGRLGGARKKASTETAFEASKGNTGK